MSADHLHGFRIGTWKVEPLRGVVTGPQGVTRHLEPKVMDVFVCLAEHANELVTREELQEAVWSGRAVTNEPLTRAIGELRHALEDGGGDSQYIETVPKRGYRLLATVRGLGDSSDTIESNGVSGSLFDPVWALTHKHFVISVVAIVGLLLAAMLTIFNRWSADQIDDSQSERSVRRYMLNLGPTQGLWETGLSTHVAVSRDGRFLVYAARVEGTTQLYLRALNQLEAEPIPGTEGAMHPFFSPDGRWVAFFDDIHYGELKKVPVNGGIPEVLADALSVAGGSWSSDGTIVLSTRHVATMPWRSLVEIPAIGGTPRVLLASDSQVVYQWPDVLPDGQAVLFTRRVAAKAASQGSIAVLSFENEESRTVVDRGYTGKFARSGHIVFARGETVWAVPFDPEHLQTTGPETLVLEGVQVDRMFGGVSYAFSDDGTLVYAPRVDGARRSNGQRLVWVDREGREEALPAEPHFSYTDRPRISPDGQHVALEVGVDGNIDVWLYDFLQGTSRRLTFHPSIDEVPLWTPDGKRVIFLNHELGGLFWRAADGTGQVERLTTNQVRQRPESFSPDGKRLVVTEVKPGASESDLHVLSLEGEPTSQPLLQTRFDEARSAISPDGRWIAYESNETGRGEVHVRPFPNVDHGKWQISSNGGSWPRWGPYGRELFYRAGEAMMVVPIDSELTFSFGNPEVLFTGNYDPWRYDVSSDGQRFLMIKDAEQAEQIPEDTQLIVVENWFEELHRLAPPSP